MRRTLLFLSTMLPLLWGCLQSDESPVTLFESECHTDSECPGGAVCIWHLLVNSCEPAEVCETDGDCDTDSECVLRTPTLVEEAPTRLTSQREDCYPDCGPPFNPGAGGGGSGGNCDPS